MKSKILLTTVIAIVMLLFSCTKKCSDCPPGNHLEINNPENNQCICCPDGYHWCDYANTCCPDGYNYSDGNYCYDYAGYLANPDAIPCD